MEIYIKIYRDLDKKHYGELCFNPFPVVFTCTLQGFSGTQGNPVKFTAKTFAVCGYYWHQYGMWKRCRCHLNASWLKAGCWARRVWITYSYLFNAAQPGVGRVQVLGSKKKLQMEDQQFCQEDFCWLSSVLWFEVQVGLSLGYPDREYLDKGIQTGGTQTWGTQTC